MGQPVTEARASGRAWYLIFVLTMAYTVSFIDRQVLNLLVEPIKAEYGLSDTRLSLLQGLAFTVSYIVMSPIFGRLADVGNRRNILALGIALWSIGTLFCGLARSYTQLFIARLSVGGAEACLTPAAWSIIPDSVPAPMLPRAFSIYFMGPYLGGGLALIFGGILLQSAGGWDLSGVPILSGLAPWQLVFVIVSLPGLLIALLLVFVREPARQGSSANEQATMSLREVLAIFVARRGFYANFYLGMSALIIALYAFPAWIPTVLIRAYGASPGDVGIQYGSLVLVTGSVGVLTGPWIAKLFRLDTEVKGLLLIPILSSGLLILTCMMLPLASSYQAALAVAGIAGMLYSLPQALGASALQLATPSGMRGIASAVYVFAVSIVGLGGAPTIVALITDQIFGDEKRVGESLAITCGVAGLLAVIFLWRSRRAYMLAPGEI
jgi:MFS family permease